MDNYKEGTCRWFASGGQSYGFIDYDGDKQVYVHYKNILPNNQRDPKYREMRKGDKCKFKVGEGFRNSGTQAVEVEIIEYAEDSDQGQEV